MNLMRTATHSYLQDAWIENPFDSDNARSHSSYSGFGNGELVPATDHQHEHHHRDGIHKAGLATASGEIQQN
jgi:hypothetical protein